MLVGDRGEKTTVGVYPGWQLVCIDGRRQNNPQPRCAPLRPAAEIDLHVILDHSILEVILNNVSAITGSVAPSSERAGGVELFGLSETAAKELDVWTLADANNELP